MNLRSSNIILLHGVCKMYDYIIPRHEVPIFLYTIHFERGDGCESPLCEIEHERQQQEFTLGPVAENKCTPLLASGREFARSASPLCHFA